MGSLSMPHLLILGCLLLLVFGGKGKISSIMGDFAQGIKSFKKGMAEDEAEAKRTTAEPARPADPVRTIDHRAAPVEPIDTRRVG
jgi:sec-independent protein translocase protein TatA